MIDVCLRKSDELEGIFDLDQNANLLTYAARIAKCAGRTEQAQQLYERTIHFHDEIGYGLTAAVIALEAGMPEKSMRIRAYEEELRNFHSKSNKN